MRLEKAAAKAVLENSIIFKARLPETEYTMEQKKIATIQDLSCMGRCSLSVALPIISAAGIETCIIPTAVLSTHTGGFTGFTFRDLTDDIEPIIEHWKTLPVKFDAIHSGYLGNARQIEMVIKLFDTFKSDNTIIIVDPAMADNGKLYSVFSSDFPQGMARVVAKADLVLPNITEASLLLDEEYIEAGYSEEYIKRLLTGMATLGPKKVIITGVQYEEGKIGAAIYDSEAQTFGYVCGGKHGSYYHGTGDIFTSAVLSGLMNEMSLENATRLAVNLTRNSIIATDGDNVDLKYGVHFEQALPSFIKELGLI